MKLGLGALIQLLDLDGEIFDAAQDYIAEQVLDTVLFIGMANSLGKVQPRWGSLRRAAKKAYQHVKKHKTPNLQDVMEAYNIDEEPNPMPPVE